MKQDRLTRLGVAVVAVEAIVAASVVFVLAGVILGAEPAAVPTPVKGVVPVALAVPTSTGMAELASTGTGGTSTSTIEAASPAREEVALAEGLQAQFVDQAGGIEASTIDEGATAAAGFDLRAAKGTRRPGPVSHVVKPGENLYRVSLAYGVSVESIMTANGLTDPRLIYAGQILTIPMSEAIAPPAVALAPTQNVQVLAASPVPPTASPLASSPLASSPPLPTTTAQPSPPEETPAGAGAPAPAEPTATPPEPTAQPVATPTKIPTAEPSPQIGPVTVGPLPAGVNGIPNELYVAMSPAVVANIRNIYARGQALGLNPRAFSKVGDSTIENPFFLARFDGGPYNLGDYAALQQTIDYYADSFGRQGVAVRRGLHSWTATDPMWADKSVCLGNESPVACEIRLNRPSILLIRLGSNDAGVPDYFESNMRQVVELAIERGVIPVIGTKADRFEGGSNINNEILRRIAADYQIPLWDYDLVAGTIPGRGLDSDGVHLTTFYAHDYTSPDAFRRGHSVHNLTALITLDTIRKALNANS